MLDYCNSTKNTFAIPFLPKSQIVETFVFASLNDLQKFADRKLTISTFYFETQWVTFFFMNEELKEKYCQLNAPGEQAVVFNWSSSTITVHQEW